MTIDRTILITGVTGKQGGAVAHALQGSGFHLRGLTGVTYLLAYGCAYCERRRDLRGTEPQTEGD